MRPLQILVLLVALVLASKAVQAGYSIETAGLKVIFPPDNKKTVQMAMADFGKPRYGATMIGNLIYPSSQPGYGGSSGYTCFPEDCQYGCQNFNASKPVFKIDRQPGQFYIMLLDRGPRNQEGHTACYFLDKVFNAQAAGADAVLVANDAPGELSTAVAPEDDDTAKELQSLTISAAMISLDDANLLRKLMLANPQVTVMLNWTSVVPKSSVVSWEFWTNSNDDCGFSCREQLKFIADMKDKAQALETAGKVKFSPHYLLWNCPAAFINTTECQTECIMNGTYCVPDPDDDPTKGYSGRDVLAINMRQLCFHRLASAAGKAQLWWDYATRFAANCSMAAKTYTVDCAVGVFESLGGADLAPGQTGRAVWDACAGFNESAALAAAATNPAALKIPVLEDELANQRGNDSLGISGVSILPTVRINGRQYRGSLDVGGVMRAICSGFPAGQEPAVCNQGWVSEDECAPGGVGYLACMSGDGGVAGKTKCVNTFQGYSCECKDGMYKYVNPMTGEERCEDVNECLATNVPLTDPACACPRCACVNKVGSYKCTGPLENKCKAELNWGGCWSGTVKGETFTSCVDTVWEFQRMAARGLANETSPWFKCECPKCFRATATNTCEPVCDLDQCDRNTGYCSPKGGGGSKTDSTGGGGGGGSSKSGVSVGGIIGIALASAALTGGLVLAANRYLMKQRMGDEIRDIMAQYMPLQERERNALLAARAGGGGRAGRGPGGGIRPDEDSDDDGNGVGAYGWPGAPHSTAAAPPGGSLGPLGPPAPAAPTLAAAGQRAVWGPPPVNAAAPPHKPAAASSASARPAAASAAAARPAADVFTLGEAPMLPSSTAARAASDADPLLGLEMGAGVASPLEQAGPKQGGKPEDNPFL
ncbi:hypothetical protein CHLRE_02g095111v5 [Chlamydomonas reinhardtii]|uniref:Uncharacterized protein n=1 Tax=Chlamydomonas reinhardtii TaxID=3055 RepID=A0A2K3E1T7_CHLRE|nr:uncharacterized protein CHLRE_02g095111v5 [Chlamydomonas reinhardtii]PNW86726.1 hypothetical protein CHLRE_02g095111v5 [Chlamydomonas reinhardtii]